MEETALPLRAPSTLAPPPLETAATGTRALQRFDLGRMRLKPEVAQATDEPDETNPASAPDEIEIIVTTLRMAVPPSIKNLPPVAWTPGPMKNVESRPGPFAELHQAAWGLAASASLVGAASLASAVVYVLFFP